MKDGVGPWLPNPIRSASSGFTTPLLSTFSLFTTYIENPNITPQEIESIEVLKDGASSKIRFTTFFYHAK